MGSHRRTTLVVTAAVAVGVLGGGAATYAATSVTDPDTNRPAGAGAVAVSAGMMDGRDTGMGMGSFDADAPFDAQFLDQMMMHHQGALMSTRAMIADSTRPELRDLADDIITSQSTQLDQMRTWRQQWYPDLAPTFAMGGPGDAMMGSGMMSGSMMSGSSDEMMGASDGGMMSGSGDEMMGASDGGMMSGSMMSGPATDRMYLQMMIAHHQLAVDMAEQAQAQAAHPDLVDLAATIAIEQAAEIDRMRGYLADLSAPPQD